jgi:uncharacterized protein YeaO (DUF488 family)
VVIRQASIYEVLNASDSAGLRVLVMRYWPRGIRRERVDRWLKDAAPSRELLRAYTHGDIDTAELDRRYREAITSQRPDVLGQLRELEREHGTLTLLCRERIPPSTYCHRLALADLLAKT